MTNIAVIVGSIRAESFNKKLANNLKMHAPKGTTFTDVDIATLPLFNQDHEMTDYPASAQAMKDIILAADGILIVTPEYNRSIPGVLKNAIDWVSRPWGQSAFKGKPVGVVGASGSHTGTSMAQAHLKHSLLFLDTKILGQPELYFGDAVMLLGADGVVADADRIKNIEDYMKALVDHVEANKL